MSAGRSPSPKREYARGACDQLTRLGAPDLYNYVAKRTIAEGEAKIHGWHMFYDGVSECSRGHIAARYVVNPAMCSDCNRENSGKVAIYPNKGGDLTSPVRPVYVDPIANAKFEWTEDNEGQFLTAYANSADVGAALSIIRAQYSHLLDHLEDSAEFRAKFERTKAERVAQVQLWKTEALGVSGSERAAISMFAPLRAKNELGARNTRTPEQLRARTAARLQRLIGQDRRALGNGAEIPEKVAGLRGPEPGHADSGASGVGPGPDGRGAAAPDDTGCDLVS